MEYVIVAVRNNKRVVLRKFFGPGDQEKLDRVKSMVGRSTPSGNTVISIKPVETNVLNELIKK